MARTETFEPKGSDALGPAVLSRPDLEDLMEKAYVLVAIASPPRPPRSRVESLLGEGAQAEQAIDALLERGFLTAVVNLEHEPRLVLGEKRWPLRLPGERGPYAVDPDRIER